MYPFENNFFLPRKHNVDKLLSLCKAITLKFDGMPNKILFSSRKGTDGSSWRVNLFNERTRDVCPPSGKSSDPPLRESALGQNCQQRDFANLARISPAKWIFSSLSASLRIHSYPWYVSQPRTVSPLSTTARNLSNVISVSPGQSSCIEEVRGGENGETVVQSFVGHVYRR